MGRRSTGGTGRLVAYYSRCQTRPDEACSIFCFDGLEFPKDSLLTYERGVPLRTHFSG